MSIIDSCISIASCRIILRQKSQKFYRKEANLYGQKDQSEADFRASCNPNVQREICRTRKISQHSVSDVHKIADQLGITYEDIKDKSEEEVYQMFYPDKFASESLYKNPEYNYVKQLKKSANIDYIETIEYFSKDEMQQAYNKYRGMLKP